MSRYGRLLRNLLLFALVGWAGVDDYFPTVASAGDFGGENGECVLFDAAGCRRTPTAEGLAPSALHLPLIDCSPALPAARSATHRAAAAGTSSDHLYALMSLRR